jgi:hypothetical protein
MLEENKLNKLEVDAKANTEGQDPFMPKEKKKKGRPPKSAQTTHSSENKDAKAPPKASEIPTALLCRPIGMGVSGFAVNYAGSDLAAMKGDELEAFCQGLGMVIDKYLPNAMDKWGPEIVFGTVCAQYGMRVYALKKYLAMEKAKQEKEDKVLKKQDPHSNQFSQINTELPVN